METGAIKDSVILPSLEKAEIQADDSDLNAAMADVNSEYYQGEKGSKLPPVISALGH